MPASPRQYGVRISSTDDLSYSVPSSSSADTHDAIQTIVTGRKCWKTIKGKGEVVWPPYLEAALVEGVSPLYSVFIGIFTKYYFFASLKAWRSTDR